MDLKRFKLEVKGKYCDAPHSDRLMVLNIDDLDADNLLTDIDVLVICNEISCTINRRLKSVMTNDEFEKMDDMYHNFHFGYVDETAKLKDINICISGTYCEEINPKRNLEYTLGGLSEIRASIVLFEVMCVLRNNLSKTMSRMELSHIAEKFKIYNFGMTEDEEPFVTRGE